MWTAVSPDEFQAFARGAEAKTPFAVLDRDHLIALASGMPDAQSAVLLCLTWQATLQERLERGPLAGQRVARLSGGQLAEMTSRPLRTVRHALSKLRCRGAIEPLHEKPGKTLAYRLNLAKYRTGRKLELQGECNRGDQHEEENRAN